MKKSNALNVKRFEQILGKVEVIELHTVWKCWKQKLSVDINPNAAKYATIDRLFSSLRIYIFYHIVTKSLDFT